MELKLQRVRFDMSQRELGETLGISSPQMSELLSDPDKLDMDPKTILHLLGFSDRALRSLGSEQQPKASGAPIPFGK